MVHPIDRGRCRRKTHMGYRLRPTQPKTKNFLQVNKQWGKQARRPMPIILRERKHQLQQPRTQILLTPFRLDRHLTTPWRHNGKPCNDRHVWQPSPTGLIRSVMRNG